MRGQRAKQYRKLMTQYGLNFGFREPYQVLLDAQVIQDAARFKMDLAGGLEKALHGRVKPMVTQCSMRHLYNANPPVPDVVEQAKTYERRRCGHHNLEEPLDTLACFSDVMDPQRKRTNKHRYAIATQDPDVRKHMRTIKGVPLIYINRSVMILEPMSRASSDAKELEEKRKFLTEATDEEIDAMFNKKRKRAERAEQAKQAEEAERIAKQNGLPWVEDRVGAQVPGPSRHHWTVPSKVDEAEEGGAKKKRKGPKGPNPLSVKKPKKREDNTRGDRGSRPKKRKLEAISTGAVANGGG